MQFSNICFKIVFENCGEAEMDTKRKIMLAAAREFADMGYVKSRVRAICEKAGVNLAAINYHFGGKANLYLEVMDYAFRETEADMPLGGPPPKSREACISELKAWLSAMIESPASKGGVNLHKHKMIWHEMLEPSEMFPEVYERFFKPRTDRLRLLIGEALPDAAPDEGLMAFFSAVSQCVFYSQNEVLVKKISGERDFVSRNRERIIGKALKGLL